MCSYQQWWCTRCINISLTPLVALRKHQIVSACLCNRLFCWRLQETVVVRVPVWNMIQQGGKTMRQRARAGQQRGSCAINRNIVENVKCSCTVRGLYRIQMCFHAVGTHVWRVCERPSSFCNLNTGMNQDRHLCPCPLVACPISFVSEAYSLLLPCVCMCVGNHECIRVCAQMIYLLAFLSSGQHACVWACMCVHVCLCVHACVHVPVCVCVHCS